MSKPPRRIVAASAVIAAAILGIGGWIWQPWKGEAGADQQSVSPTLITSPAELGTLATSMKMSGKVSFGKPAALPVTDGILTVLPQTGAELGQGQPVYEVEGHPVILMVGPRPFWRELSLGVPDGEDIRQLQQNLADMGYYTAYVGDTFDEYTRDAIREWQADLDVEETGVFSPESVVVVPSVPIRIDRATGTLGISGTSPATFTPATRNVHVPLNDTQLAAVEIGQEVQITTEDGSTYTGVVTEITEAQPATEDQEEVRPAAIIDLAEVADLAPGEVRVTLVNTSEDSVLLVPVIALLAIDDGEYVVEVVPEGQSTPVRVSVEIGRVSQAKAEITGGNLHAGDEVVVGR